MPDVAGCRFVRLLWSSPKPAVLLVGCLRVDPHRHPDGRVGRRIDVSREHRAATPRVRTGQRGAGKRLILLSAATPITREHVAAPLRRFARPGTDGGAISSRPESVHRAAARMACLERVTVSWCSTLACRTDAGGWRTQSAASAPPAVFWHRRLGDTGAEQGRRAARMPAPMFGKTPCRASRVLLSSAGVWLIHFRRFPWFSQILAARCADSAAHATRTAER
ncbi:hypothetical protein GCM10009608_30900 [Pseudonocardia alaniniphila]